MFHRQSSRLSVFDVFSAFSHSLDSETVISLFSEYEALFLDRADRDVYPRLVPGKDDKTVQRLLDNFYIWVSMYEMTRQWLVEDGPFDYDYG